MELTLRFPETFPETAKSVPLNPPVLRGRHAPHTWTGRTRLPLLQAVGAACSLRPTRSSECDGFALLPLRCRLSHVHDVYTG